MPSSALALSQSIDLIMRSSWALTPLSSKAYTANAVGPMRYGLVSGDLYGA